MPEYQVWYTVPVAVHVDTDTGEVLRVVVIDEQVTLDDHVVVTLPDYSGPAPEDAAYAAIDVAEGRPWTAWEFGY